MNSQGSDHHDAFFAMEVDLPYCELNIEQIQVRVASELCSRDYPKEGVFAVRLAIEEALVNAYRHGNKKDADKRVTFECSIDSTSARFEVSDEGPGFDISSVPDPTDEANLEIPSGRGLLLMREYMTQVEFVPPGNRVRMHYQRLAE